MRLLRIVVSALAVVVALPASARAQDSLPPVGAHVKVYRDTRVTAGTLIVITTDSLTLEVEAGLDLTISRADVTRVEEWASDVVRHRNFSIRGMIAGASLGALFGLTEASILCAITMDGCGPGGEVRGPAQMIFVGSTVIGAVIGALKGERYDDAWLAQPRRP
jgi:hypothetical protein